MTLAALDIVIIGSVVILEIKEKAGYFNFAIYSGNMAY